MTRIWADLRSIKRRLEVVHCELIFCKSIEYPAVLCVPFNTIFALRVKLSVGECYK